MMFPSNQIRDEFFLNYFMLHSDFKTISAVSLRLDWSQARVKIFIYQFFSNLHISILAPKGMVCCDYASKKLFNLH